MILLLQDTLELTKLWNNSQEHIIGQECGQTFNNIFKNVMFANETNQININYIDYYSQSHNYRNHGIQL